MAGSWGCVSYPNLLSMSKWKVHARALTHEKMKLHSEHSDEHAASKQARDLYERGWHSVSVTSPEGKDSSKWASSEMAKKSEKTFRKAFEQLDKSKNVREQKKKVFGTNSAPKAGSEMQEKHIAHISKFAKKFLGLDLKPSGGKIDVDTGKRKNKDAEEGVDKPDWRSGQLEAQWNPDAIIHELAHLMLLPQGVGLKQGQQLMDKQYGDVQRDYGYMKQKRSQGEVQPMAAEQLIRRVLGLPANRNSVAVPSKDAPPRVAVEDPNKVIGTRVKTGKNKAGQEKWADLIRQSNNLSPENKERMHAVFSRKVVFHPEQGWIENKKQGVSGPFKRPLNFKAYANKIKSQKPQQSLQEVANKVMGKKGEKLAAKEKHWHIEYLEKMPMKPHGQLSNGKHFYLQAHHPAHKTFTGQDHAEASKHLHEAAVHEWQKGHDNDDGFGINHARGLAIAAKAHGEQAKAKGLPKHNNPKR